MKNLPLIWLLLPFASHAQSVIGTTGNEGTVGNIVLSYTVGESFITTLENDSIVSSQGFHQPYYIVTTIEEQFLPGKVNVFPNPTSSVLNVQFEDIVLENLIISFHDITGKLILTSKVTTNTWQTNLFSLANGYYILTITDQITGKSNSFKIFKSN